MNAIEFKNVSFKYDEENPSLIIDNVDLTIKKGEFVCILGPNGSGKSTLARLINGLLSPLSGEVFVFEKNVADKKSLFEVTTNIIEKTPCIRVELESAILNPFSRSTFAASDTSPLESLDKNERAYEKCLSIIISY